MTLRRITCLALLLLAVVGIDTPAQAGPADAIAAQAASAAIADGDDTIAYLAAPGDLRLLDRQGAPTASVDLSGGCVQPPAQIDAVGGGELLFGCAVEHDFSFGRFLSVEPRLLDLATREVRVPAGAVDAYYNALAEPLGSGRFTDVGAHGLRFERSYYHAGLTVEAIDWRTGARVLEPTTPTDVLDVDSPTLRSSVCAPLTRRPWDVSFGGVVDPPPSFDPFSYEKPYGLAWGLLSPLTLRRCGATKATALEPWPRHRTRLIDPQLGGGVASWVVNDPRDQGSRWPLRAYLPACGVRLERRVGGLSGDPLLVPQVAHVRGALVVSEQLRDEQGPWRIRRLSLSGVCERTARAWSLTAAAGGRSVQLRADAGATARLVNRGWLASRVQLGGVHVPSLPVQAGATIRLFPGERAHAMRWRLGSGRWHALRSAGERWQLRIPQDALGQRLTVGVRSRQGGEARFTLRLAGRG